jgi:hypothetical protein
MSVAHMSDESILGFQFRYDMDKISRYRRRYRYIDIDADISTFSIYRCTDISQLGRSLKITYQLLYCSPKTKLGGAKRRPIIHINRKKNLAVLYVVVLAM